MPRRPLTPEGREQSRKRINLRRAAWLRERMKDPEYREAFNKRRKSWEARHRIEHPGRHMLYSLRSRSRHRGRAFYITDITVEDLVFPTHCPALGIELDYGAKRGRAEDNSPSFGRIDNARGYVRGNVIVVSNLANRIKNSATPAQIRAVADFYDSLSAR